MRLFLFFLLAAVAGSSLGSRAQEAAEAQAPVLVELFTSQGCASCPPADALLSQISALPGVIALALHVDYWDYLGWKDHYANPRFSARQRSYAKRAGARSIFTPQMVVQGSERFKGHDAKRVQAAIDSFRRAIPSVRLSLVREGAMIRIDLSPIDPPAAAVAAADRAAPAPGAASGTLPAPQPAEAAPPAPRPAAVHVATFLPQDEVSIGAGENSGRRVVYSNIVTSWETIADWDRAGPLQLVYRVPDDGPLAVIVQEEKTGPILTAASLP